jgi:hypothetical protein
MRPTGLYCGKGRQGGERWASVKGKGAGERSGAVILAQGRATPTERRGELPVADGQAADCCRLREGGGRGGERRFLRFLSWR